MATPSSLSRAHLAKTLLAAMIAVAVVALFLSPVGALAGTGVPSPLGVSPHGVRVVGTAPASAPAGPAEVGADPAAALVSSLGVSVGGVVSGAAPTPQVAPLSFARVATGASTASGSSSPVAIPVAKMLSPTGSAPSGAGPRPTSYEAGWSGINYTMCQCQPEDPSVAAGPSDVVEETSYQFYVYNKVGAVLFNESLAKFFGNSSYYPIMPRILYDNLTGRWFTTAVVKSTLYGAQDNLTLAVSATSDPTGTWHVYGPIAPPRHQYPYYPSIGVSRWMVGIGVDDFNRSTYAEYSQLFVFNKTEMMAGTSPAYTSWGLQNGYLFAPDLVATTSLGPSVHQYFSGIIRTGVYLIWNVSGAPPAIPTHIATSVSFPNTATVPVASVQPGFSVSIEAGSGGIISSYERNGLVSSSWSAYDGKFDVIRVTQAWDFNITLRQDLVVHSGLANFLFPAMGLDSRGDLTILAGISSKSLFPGLITVGQAYNEPYTISNGYGFVIAGSSIAKNPNWGYYFGAGTDPTSSVIWLVGDYMSTTDFWGSSYVVGLQTDPISVSLRTSAATIDLGQSVTFSATSAGGTGFYNYNWTSLPPGCLNSDRSSLTCTPTSAGAVSVKVTASDAFPTRASTSISLTVNPSPTLSAPTASKPGADVGQTVTFTSASAVGGTPAFTYNWSGLPAGCGSPTASSVVCTFTTGGALSLTVTATDSLNVAARSASFPYTVSPPLVVPAPTSTPVSANTGTTFTFSVTPSGGSGADQYSWLGLPTGCTSSNATFIVCVAATAGKFNVTVAVTDSNGATVTSANVVVTVTTPVSSGQSGLSGATSVIIVGVIFVAVAALLLLFVMRRRKPTSSPPTGQTAPSARLGPGALPAGAAGDVPPGVGGMPPPRTPPS